MNCEKCKMYLPNNISDAYVRTYFSYNRNHKLKAKTLFVCEACLKRKDEN